MQLRPAAAQRSACSSSGRTPAGSTDSLLSLPRALRTLAGETISVTRDGVWRLSSHLPGEEPADVLARQPGRLLAIAEFVGATQA